MIFFENSKKDQDLMMDVSVTQTPDSGKNPQVVLSCEMFKQHSGDSADFAKMTTYEFHPRKENSKIHKKKA